VLVGESLKDRRAATEVRVGRRAMEFESMTVERAAYGTGWEGTIVIDASERGRITVRSAEGTN
jgi:hypothetical protein